MMPDSLGKSEITDRHDMRRRIVRFGVTAAICERVELLGIAEIKACLIVNPGPQTAFERTMFNWIERTKWQDVGSADPVRLAAHDERDRLILGDCNDSRIKANADRRRKLRVGIWSPMSCLGRRLSPA